MNTEKKGLTRIDISVVIPFYNEEESLAELYNKLVNVLINTGKTFEIIFIDDGSTDNSYQVVKEIQESDSRVKLIKFKTNAGKARGLNEGFKMATGDIVFTMDADLQDDPEEIPNFLSKIKEGYDLVSGWKKERHDPLEKRLPSKLFNRVTSLVTGVKLHDFNCGFKAYRREILDEIKVYGELHRYIPALARWQGYRIGEIPVRHHARKYGHSKYGWERYLRGFFDLFTVILLTKYVRNPLHLFGFAGFASLLVGGLIICFLTGLQIIHGGIMGRRPLSFFAVLLVLTGGQLVSLGLMAEFLSNISQKIGARKISIKRKKNILQEDQRKPEISVIIPVNDEEGNVELLYRRLIQILAEVQKEFEIVFVDDGSIDDSYNILKSISEQDPRVKIIQLRKRFGKASALSAGFSFARGQLIVTMDGDLQDNPEDVRRLLAEIENQPIDFVCGRRVKVPFPRNISSRIFNLMVSVFSGVKLRDVNCGLKVFNRKVISGLSLYGGLQRFLPIIAAKNGFRFTELDVMHNERHSGRSKYGWSRIPKGFLDLMTVVLLTGYRRRPLHLFGSIGFLISGVGFIVCCSLTIVKIVTGSIQGHNTMLLMGVMLLVLGLQWLSAGLVGEMINDLDEEIDSDNILEIED